ncbi:MAG TPA: WecB/TagA/CpsF family glycosyltransferase [Tissierellales bacterium]|nr:WecB/TagA/CpsF family glycosyltransferase [Tissierellales bacterium]
MNSIKIFGVMIDKVTLEEATKLVEEFLKGNELKTIYTPNTEIVMKAKEDERLKKLINKGSLVIPDGIGLIYAAKIKKRPLPQRVTGFDLSINMIELANKKKLSIYLLGGKPGVSEEAAKNIVKKYPNVKIAGYQHGYFKEEKEIISKINESNPDILFVGLGFPKQEVWIDTNKGKLNSKVVIGNGGTMDILAGKVKRAPEIYQKLGLEWFYRLLKEPSRIKRQIVIPKFILQVIFSKNVVE